MASRGEVDDGQPAVLQAHPYRAMRQGKVFQPSVVRAAVTEFQSAFFVRGRAADLSKDSTHNVYCTLATRVATICCTLSFTTFSFRTGTFIPAPVLPLAPRAKRPAALHLRRHQAPLLFRFRSSVRARHKPA